MIAIWLIYLLVTIAVLSLTAPVGSRTDRGLIGLALFILATMPASQALGRNRLTYPIASWRMYADKSPSTSYQQYLITDDHGQQYHYPFRLVAFSSTRAFMARLDQLIVQCRCDGGDRVVDEAFEALAEIHQLSTGRVAVAMEAFDVSVIANSEARTRRYSWSLSGEPRSSQ